MSQVNDNVSDLFFNTDHDNAQRFVTLGGARVFDGYDERKLRENAEMFLSCLRSLGLVACLPSVDALLQDFHGRI